jgi:hypothetical protein
MNVPMIWWVTAYIPYVHEGDMTKEAYRSRNVWGRGDQGMPILQIKLDRGSWVCPCATLCKWRQEEWNEPTNDKSKDWTWTSNTNTWIDKGTKEHPCVLLSFFEILLSIVNRSWQVCKGRIQAWWGFLDEVSTSRVKKLVEEWEMKFGRVEDAQAGMTILNEVSVAQMKQFIYPIFMKKNN